MVNNQVLSHLRSIGFVAVVFLSQGRYNMNERDRNTLNIKLRRCKFLFMFFPRWQFSFSWLCFNLKEWEELALSLQQRLSLFPCRGFVFRLSAPAGNSQILILKNGKFYVLPKNPSPSLFFTIFLEKRGCRHEFHSRINFVVFSSSRKGWRRENFNDCLLSISWTVSS